MKLNEISNKSPISDWMAECSRKRYTTTISNTYNFENGILNINGNLSINGNTLLPFPEMPFKINEAHIMILSNLDLSDGNFNWQPKHCNLIDFNHCKLPVIKDSLFGDVSEIQIASTESNIPEISHDMYTSGFPFIYRLFIGNSRAPQFTISSEGNWIKVTDQNKEFQFTDIFDFQDYLANHPNEKLQSLMI